MNRKLKARIIEEYGSQADFAQMLGEDESFISRIVRRRRELPEDKQKAWARLLGCRREELFGE